MLSIRACPSNIWTARRVAGPAIDQHRFRAPQRVRAELGRIEPDTGDPFMNEARVLSCGEPVWSVAATGKEELPWLPSSQSQVLFDGQASLIRQLEPNRPARLLLPDGCAVHGISAWCHIIDAQGVSVGRQARTGDVVGGCWANT